MTFTPKSTVLVCYPSGNTEEPQSIFPKYYNEFADESYAVFVYELKGRAKITNNVKVEVKPLSKGK